MGGPEECLRCLLQGSVGVSHPVKDDKALMRTIDHVVAEVGEVYCMGIGLGGGTAWLVIKSRKRKE